MELAAAAAALPGLNVFVRLFSGLLKWSSLVAG